VPRKTRLSTRSDKPHYSRKKRKRPDKKHRKKPRFQSRPKKQVTPTVSIIHPKKETPPPKLAEK
jgi:hypothetical protein